MSNLNVNIGSSLLKFTFSDSDGEILAAFRMNPADIKLAQRCQELSGYFDGLKDKVLDNANLDDIVAINNEIEDKICYMLGYDAKQSLFGMISATSVLADGNMFVVHVLDKINEVVEPEIEKRKRSAEKAMAKHTAKYAK